MILAHISDIHAGPQFKKEAFKRAATEINELRPDAVLATGDFTENGLLSEFTTASQYLRKIQCRRKIFVSGNHDYRSTGYLLFKRFFPSEAVTEVGDAVVITLSTARPDRDDGEVGHRQNLWLEETLRKHRGRMKIVALHHHVVPVPDTGRDDITITDAGDVLRSLVRGGVDLVLCGHRHRPWIWRVENLTVVNAGTVSSERTRGFFSNSYNIIEITGRKIDARLKVVGGTTIPLTDVVKKDLLGLPGTTER